MKSAVREGYAVLKKTGNVVDAVEAAIKVMEYDPAFNAGRGAVLNILGHVEMDASIMDGKDCNAGAVASISGIKNPISLARYVMENTSHVLMVAEGAKKLAKMSGFKSIPEKWFITEKAIKELDEFKIKHNMSGKNSEGELWRSEIKGGAVGHGTVGAVAYYKGHIAAGTSTGGLTGKLPGRVGDSPILGQGVFADNLR